ncbi:MAG: pectate lyase, partial [Bacteroidales bacterium]|nr:pectate lyase [Bacteroidales bacterium]
VTQIEGDAIWGRNQKDIILDHCSMSWATDETSSFYDNENFTMQWCILAESLRMSLHGKGAHGYTGIWGGRKASFIKNLIAHSDNRNPRFCGSRYSGRPNDELVDFRNNVIYNWGANSSTAGEGGSYNMVNNYYQPGPQSVNNTRIMQPWGCTGEHNQPAGTTGVFYVTGNVMRNVNGTVNTNVTNNNWNGVSGNNTVPQGRNLRSDTEFEKGTVTTLTAEEAYEQVLDKAGASHVRDAVDIRVVNEVRNRLAPARASVSGGGTRAGMIDSQEDVGGWSPLNSLPPAPRTLKGTANDDGIPDAWKIANGLPLNQNMANRYNLSNIYTNLEVYLNSLVGE